MKTVITNYTFNTDAKTITFSDFNTTNVAVDLKRLYLITDVTTNTILYNFADYTVSAATVAGATITLSQLPSNANSSYSLNIVYEALPTDPVPLQVLESRTDGSSTANTFYVGEAPVGSSESSAVWRIAAIIISGNSTSYKYANNGYFASVWSNRTSLTYN